MTLLIRAQQITLAYGHQTLFDEASFTIKKGDRMAIIGMNGMGKSTLLKVIERSIKPDSGNIEYAKDLQVAMMQQDVPKNLSGSVLDYYREQSPQAADYAHERMISQLGLSEDLQLNQASGGQIRRVLLGQALLDEPDVLLLDEPTNHMDIETILWMEKWLLRLNKTIIFITHDRSFMQQLATGILEVDLGRVITWQGDYEGFLKHKATEDQAREKSQALFDKKLAQEEVWIRQGIKARRTRNEGRVRALKAMRDERSKRQQRMNQMQIHEQREMYGSKIAFDLQDVSYQTPDNSSIIRQLNALIIRGDKIGIIGPNGCGKSTLFRLLTGEIQPMAGTIKKGVQCQICYFDQHRDQLDLNQTAFDNVSQGRSQITINGKDKHVMSYLQDFMFSPDKARSLVRSLSGGERNRLMLAKMLSQPSNVLILDEPSNDLDTDTLALLEEFLCQYPGTVLMASHDRSLLNQVVTSLLVFKGNGEIESYVGNYEQWQEMQHAQAENIKKHSDALKPAKKSTAKLSHEENKELRKLPGMIEKLEAKISQEQQEMADPSFYQQDKATIAAMHQAHEEKQKKLAAHYERWEFLEEKR